MKQKQAEKIVKNALAKIRIRYCPDNVDYQECQLQKGENMCYECWVKAIMKAGDS